ncbi:MAG: hypothetical protein ACKVKF_01300 [Rhodobacterales bacterium]|nr:hypothetical protein [Puniceibacterium antarcticum]
MTLDNPKDQALIIDGVDSTDAPALAGRLAALAPAEKQNALNGPLVQEMITAMQGASVPMVYASESELLDEILVRLAAVDAMTSLTSGAYDCDYFDPNIDLKPRIGTTDNSRTSRYWKFLNPTDHWDAAWRQTPQTPPSTAIAPEYGSVLPFRGECAGAYQLVIYWGLLNGLGADRFALMAEKFGTMLVGPWSLGPISNPATLFMPKAPLEDPPIPGDYMYFQNKDDYPELAPDGFWMGLNSMYMGKDALGTRHYSGMGASWQTEANLRMELSNAYYQDCYPHQIEAPLTEVRFTVRALLQLPKEQNVAIEHSADTDSTFVIHAPNVGSLQNAGYTLNENGVLTNPSTTLGALAGLFGTTPEHIRQFRSAGLSNPPGRISFGGVTAVLFFADPEADRNDPAAVVSVHVHMHRNA